MDLYSQKDFVMERLTGLVMHLDSVKVRLKVKLMEMQKV